MGDSVCIAYLHTLEVAHSWHASYTASLLYDLRPGGPGHLRGGHLGQYGSELTFDAARNKVIEVFLDEKPDVEWLWWIDADMGWSHTALEELMAVADAKRRPIVGGLCFGTRPVAEDGHNGQMFRIFPTAYALDEQDDAAGFSPIYAYPVNEVIQVGATGSAFVLIHRSVFEKIRDALGEVWYDRVPHPKNKVAFGEDLSFCLRAISLDIPVHVHTGVRTNHFKHEYLSEQRFFQQMQAPPATERTAVLVPVVSRPHNAEPFMRSLRASTGMAEVYAICEPNDVFTRAAWERAGAKIIAQTSGRPGTFAAKVNDGYQATGEPWVFIVGDDVTFTPGWLDAAQYMGNRYQAGVVGTNDNANPRVMAGEHATHMLIRRSYIDEQGASWDGPGVLAHEGYGHWYVDDEIVRAAKQRDTWIAALGSIVEHHHPLFDRTVEMDEVYERGQLSAGRDKVLHAKRRAKYAGKAVAA